VDHAAFTVRLGRPGCSMPWEELVGVDLGLTEGDHRQPDGQQGQRD
jgi:hypothetical protein